MAETLGIVASIIAVVQLTGKLTSISYGYIGGVKRAGKDLGELLRELGALSGVFIALQHYIDANPQSAPLQRLNDPNGPLRECTKELEELILKLEPRDGWKGVADNLRWPLKEKDTSQYISRLERHKSLFILALQMDHVSLLRAIEEHAKVTKADIKDIQGNIEEIKSDLQAESTLLQAQIQDKKERRRAAKRVDVLSWLCPGNVDKKHTEIKNLRQKGTGLWLPRRKEFQEWSKEKPDFRPLCGYGIPGAGKTSLSSIVIDHFKAQIPKSGYGIAHVYFDYKEQDQQTPTYVLASLVKQLLRQISYLPTEIEALYDTLKTKDRRPTLDELYSALLVAKECFPRVFLIFDALDECNPEKQRKPLLPLFHRMGRDSMSLFLTSRPHPEDIRDSLTGYDDATSIELAAQDEDMVAYTQEKIKENPRAKRLIKQGKCQDRIISSLVDCAEGMFLLVRFHVEYLCRQTSAKQILTELDRLSTGKGSLDPTYDRAMEDLRGQPKNYVELAFKVLCWLVKSRRTLTVDEILVAVSVEPNRYELDELDLPDTAILLDVCAGLVVIDKDTNIIRLAHYTVQEYLIRNSLLQHTEFHLAMVCTTYLSFDVFKTGPSTTYEAFEDRTQSHPLFTYAVSHLLPHLKACNENQTTDMILKFLSCPGSISVYLEGCDIKEGYSWTRSLVNLDPYSPLIDFLSLPLHWASSLGHHAVISQLLNEGVDLSLVDDDGSTALHLATSAGYGNVVQTLLEKGADHAIRDNNGKTALHYAASKTGKEMIRILLKSGADPSICDSSGRTALHLAVIGGDEVIARMLLENEVDHSVVDEFWKTALHYAMEKGHEVIVGMLLENGADHSIPNLSGQTVLHLASTARHKHIVKALLLRGASHSIPDSYGQTALHFASSAGFKDVAQLLLKNGAGHWTQDNSGKTALHFASIAGCKDIAQLLLENGADHWIPDNSGKTALHSASFAGFKGVVQVLPQNGAQHLAQDDTGDTALHLASRAEREDVVQTLLENGADHSIPNGNGRTALHLASLAGYNGIVQTLLDNGGYHWIPDNKGKTPLHLASLAGCKDVVQTLLGNGASHMTLNDDGKSALDYALLGGHEAISQMLLGGGGEN